MRRGKHRRRGASLLEVIVALAILGASGIVTLSLTEAAARAVHSAARAEDEVRSASVFVDAVSLWSASDLDRHLGARTQGRWRMYVEREGALYKVLLFDGLSRRPLIETALYRHGTVESIHAR